MRLSEGDESAAPSRFWNARKRQVYIAFSDSSSVVNDLLENARSCLAFHRQHQSRLCWIRECSIDADVFSTYLSVGAWWLISVGTHHYPTL